MILAFERSYKQYDERFEKYYLAVLKVNALKNRPLKRRCSSATKAVGYGYMVIDRYGRLCNGRLPDPLQ